MTRDWHDKRVTMGETPLTACPQCDLLVRHGSEPQFAHYSALCPRCGAMLSRHHRASMENALALACACLALLVVANSFPVVGLNFKGQRIDTSVIGAVAQLWQLDMPLVSALVLLTTTVTPLLEVAGIIWLVLPLRFGRRPAGFAQVYRALRVVHPWAMVEVFVLGILVSLVKLAHLADVLPGPAMLGLAALMLALTAVRTTVEPGVLWQAWEEART